MDNMPDDNLPPPAFATDSEDPDSEEQRSADFPFDSTSSPEYGATLMNPNFLQSYVQVSLGFSEKIQWSKIPSINAF